MTAIILRRLVQAVPVLVGVTLISFALIHLLPGGPAAALLGPEATPQQIHLFTVENGWNLPVIVQYFHYMDRVIHGNLGFSYSYNQTVASLLADNIPKTALLLGLAYLLTVVIAIPVGIIQALRANSALDQTITTSSFVAHSMPTFWLSTLLILWFSVSLHLFPAEGPQGTTISADFHDLRGLVLPVLSLTMVSVATFSRFVRSSSMTVLVQDYIRTAHGKGLPLSMVLRKHLLRNVLSPMVTLFGLSLPYVIGGAVIVEEVFNYQGMGLLLFKAVSGRDYPLMVGITLVVGVATVIGNLIADLLYAVVDPRVRYD